MKTRTKVTGAIAIAISGSILLGAAGCTSDADQVSDDISQQAEQFKVQRRITVINLITDKYLMTVEGLCSIERRNTQLEAVCKVGPTTYTKTYVGLADQVTYLIEQDDKNATGASKYHHRIVLKPESVIPNFDFEAGE